jgi:hypothetical protein
MRQFYFKHDGESGATESPAERILSPLAIRVDEFTTELKNLSRRTSRKGQRDRRGKNFDEERNLSPVPPNSPEQPSFGAVNCLADNGKRLKTVW